MRSDHDLPLRLELARLIALLVDHPDEVEVSERRGRGATCFEVRVAPDDLGKVIGRQGRSAWSLRALLDVRGMQDGCRYALEIRE